MDTKEKEHPLTLKVMRLTRPSLFPGVSVTCDARDLPADLLNADLRHDLAIPSGLPFTGIGQVLLLPQSFGNIYLGETFSCCVCVHNNSPQPIQQVNIKAVLQIGSERVGLLGAEGADDIMQLGHDAVTSALIHHEVKEVGTHILVCAVSYLSLAGETQTFRKFYKFQVMKPIDIKTRFLNAEFSDEVLVEAGVENTTSGPICLERVTLEPSSNYHVVAIDSLYPQLLGRGSDGSHSSPFKERSVFGNINVLNPHDTRQYLYSLRPKQPLQAALKEPSDKADAVGAVPPPPSTIGKLDIVWRTNMGDKGRLQTSQFVRSSSAVAVGDVSVRVTGLSATVTLEQPVPLTLTLQSRCERALQLRLEFPWGNDGVCSWLDAVSRPLPILPAGEKLDLHLTLLPLRLGIQDVCSVRLRDLANPSYVMDVTRLGQVRVVTGRGGDSCGAVPAVGGVAVVTGMMAGLAVT